MSSIKYNIFLALIGFLCLLSCTEKAEKSAMSFYHWKANINIGQTEMAYMDSLAMKKLYLRFFDIHWDKENQLAQPLSVLQWKNFDMGHHLDIIPVIYITNITLEKNEYDRGIDTLAKNIANKLKQMIAKLDTVRFSVKELQLDCDWDLETQSKYFRLIQQLKNYLPQIKTFSATIRLHQVKYFTTTGVPPVDKGVLMFYNMGNVAKASEKNSILNIETAKQYLENFDIYPLQLDVALPLFAWGVHFRDDKILQLINDVSIAHLNNKENFEAIGNNKYRVLKSHYLKGIYIYKNDIIRLENIAADDLKKSMQMLRNAFKDKKFDVIFYHLEDYIVRDFNPKLLKTIINN